MSPCTPLVQKYAKDSQEKTDILLALDVPINPTVTNEKLGGRWGGPTENRFDKVGVVCCAPPPAPLFASVGLRRLSSRGDKAGVAAHRLLVMVIICIVSSVEYAYFHLHLHTLWFHGILSL